MTSPPAPSGRCPQLPLSRLGHLVPPLVEQQALVALVTLTRDHAWSAKAAWDIARIASREGRRVALVDLQLDHPTLHEIVGLSTTEGIVDAFEYGVSLTKAAHEVTGVFFIPAGTDTANAAELYAHARWPKLQAGFRSEGALLLLFLSPAGLAQLSALPDGALFLAPEGLPADFALTRDVPVLGVARDRWLPSNARTTLPAIPHSVAVTPRRRVRAVIFALIATLLAIGGWALLAGAGQTVAPAAIAPAAAAPAPVVAPRRDTLAWTVQLAAYASLDKALAHADRLAAETGIPALVTPVPQSDRGPVWYRVLAGSYATRAAAAAGRSDLWRRGYAAQGVGDLLRAPYSYRPAPELSRDALRAKGIPAVQFAGHVVIGAFESTEQAAFLQADLARAGVRAPLLPRMGGGPP